MAQDRIGDLKVQPARLDARRGITNLAAWIATLARAPRVPAERRSGRAKRSPGRAIVLPMVPAIVVAIALSVLAVVATMVFCDGWAIGYQRAVPGWLRQIFEFITEFGESGWILWPTGLLVVALALIASPALGRIASLTLSAVALRLGFVFAAVAAPGLVVAIAKRLIGRARPLHFADGGAIHFQPFSWRADYASMPSGHATTAFAAALAIGWLLPRWRPVLWLYAAAIAASRIVIGAHYPSDVLAGALVGTAGALLVRRWFALRRLGFSLAPDGAVHAFPGPSLRRIKTVARRLAGQ